MKLFGIALALVSLVNALEDVDDPKRESETLGQVYKAILKPEDSDAEQFWVDGIARISTSDTGENYLWMYHTIHTPNQQEIQIDLWAQMDVRDYIPPPP